MMRRLFRFLRSIAPRDISQLALAFGVVCFYIAPHARWKPIQVPVVPGFSGHATYSLGARLLSEWLLIFSGVAGYYIWFWPGKHPIRRIFSFLFLPVITGMTLMLYAYQKSIASHSSILEPVNHENWHSPAENILRLINTPGFRIAGLGLVLVTFFTLRFAFGKTSLPLELPEKGTACSIEPKRWGRLQFLIWMLIGPLFLVITLPSMVLVAISTNFPGRMSDYIYSDWLNAVNLTFATFLLLAICFCIVVKEDRTVFRNGLRLPEPRFVGLALAFSVGIPVGISLVQYLSDRMSWATHSFGKFEPPQFGSYFALPSVLVFYMFIPALAEELIFRGVLQYNFIRKYGTQRGIFLVGLIWVAFHFPVDFYSATLDEKEILLKLGSRILTCLSLNYAFAWLTLQSGSVLPATVAHTLFNVFVSMSFGPDFTGKGFIRAMAWAVLAWFIFRYWPPTISSRELAVPTEPIPLMTS